MKAEDILRKRRDRAIATILNVKERDIDPLLGPNGATASRVLRKAVLDQLNDFCDIAVDIATSGDAAGFEFNPEVWGPKIAGKLEEIHAAVLAGNGKD